ncbi:MAG: deoxynucleoside kinase [Bacteroidota bacterium]
MNYNYLVIEGNIGAGKTSLATRLSEEYNTRLILEQYAENPFLPKFYKEPDRYAFPVELSFLADRYQQLKNEIASPDLFRNRIISDYYFSKSLIFSRNTLKDDEFNLYRQLFQIINQQLPKPDRYIYLHLPVEQLLDNIRKRGRSYEQEISQDYLKSLEKGYFEFFKARPDLTIVVIDTSRIDFVHHEEDYQRVKKVIFDPGYRPGMNMVIM